ncbi:DUF262 domain-containing protein [Dechloromonas denitrificans]|uniref:DUF262 domain-containing protein n=1 Tax=Dechloromonas denitrificans TaxID=281362 RepID=UPI001CF847F0|nr:DUF262 domain-containing protein [Dechloromonas denitrificans]UCV10280.1 DUF262 domain-containing protein [Dechloromonas denitrificans]
MNLFVGSKNVAVVKLSEWLDWASGNNDNVSIVLPMIQRGSVWKPEQIINLWDTLLRGMPIGSFMLNSVPLGTKVLRMGIKNEKAEELKSPGYALLDGQQRTLSMLIAWQSKVLMDRRLWVDFADEANVGQVFRMRVTTENQKFGFQRQSPSTKLPLADRRKAILAYEAEHGDKAPLDFLKTCPYVNGHSLPLDLKELIQRWVCINCSEKWKAEVCSKLKKIKKWRPLLNNESNKSAWEEYLVWDALDEKLQMQAIGYVESLSFALNQLFILEIPLIKVRDEIINNNDDSLEPPLAILFKRIGTGGTDLSTADYAYSVIKNRYPETYELVETLHGVGSISTTLTDTDLVMTALRLAVAETKATKDVANPDKQEFHRMLKIGGDGLIQKFFGLIDSKELGQSFAELESILLYHKDTNPNGLPRLAFPLLGRPLIQVLLRWIRMTKDVNGTCEINRDEIIRFVLFWIMWVKDSGNASRIAFSKLESVSKDYLLGKTIADLLIKEEVAFPLISPDELEKVANLVYSISPSNPKKPLRGWHGRFFDETDNEGHKSARTFYARWWNKNNSYTHTVLLWLQREYVATLTGVMYAGREDDTPYDYDHLCPSNHWHGWTGEGNNPSSLTMFCENKEALVRVGNSIGNLRVWDSVKNRSDGDTAPDVKLKLKQIDGVGQEFEPATQSELLNWSAIPGTHTHEWLKCSRDEKNKRVWDEDRAAAFQNAVEQRTFYLYKRYFDELIFRKWMNS